MLQPRTGHVAVCPPSRSLFFPQRPPPWLWRWGCALVGHFLADIVHIPPGERGERTRLLIPALRQADAVFLGLLTRISALPRVTQDIATLEVAPVSGLLEHQILGKMVG